MRKILTASIFILSFCFVTFGQNTNCPIITVTGPSSVIQPGEPITFTAEVSGIEASKIIYKWTVSENRSFEGQETNKIQVDVKGLYDNAIKATVEILNLPKGCPNMDSETFVVACKCIAVQIDEYGKISYNALKVRLTAIKDELEKNADDVVYIVLYQSYTDKNLDKRVKQIKNFLLKENKIPEEKLFIIFGSDEPEERTKIYLVPPGAEPPTP